MKRFASILGLGFAMAHGCSLEEAGQAGSSGTGGAAGAAIMGGTGGSFPDAAFGGGTGATTGGTAGSGGSTAGSGGSGAAGGTGGVAGAAGGVAGIGGTGATGGTTGDAGVLPTNYAGLLLWLRADVGVVTTGSNVVTWADQSGKGNHYLQTNVAQQPSLVMNAIKNKPAVRFSGSPKALIGPGLGALSKLTVFVAMRAEKVPGATEYFEVVDDVSPGGGFRFGIATTSAFNGMYFGATNKLVRSQLAPADASAHVIAFSWSGADPAQPSSYTINVDGTNLAVQTTGSGYGTQTTSAIGMLSEGSVAFLKGDLFEVIVYGEQLATTDQITLSNGLMQSWTK